MEFEINAYHWLALGLILFAAEALGAAGFLLGAGAAALVIGLLTLLVPELGLTLQLSLYAGVAITATFLYLKVFRQEQEENPDSLNQRAQQLIGCEFDLAEALPNGESRIQIGDTFWRVNSDSNLAEGTRVRVAAADAMSLRLIVSGKGG
jgi:membrane protein implicated in regulation of membrane protease activity